MRLAIICAMEEELTEICNIVNLTFIKQTVKAGNNYFEYRFNNLHSIITVVCGIGKVNAAISTQILIDFFEIDALINVGVAGSLSLELGFGDVVIATDLVQHDVDVTAFGLPLGQIPRIDTFAFSADANMTNQLLTLVKVEGSQVVKGRIISGDQFIDDAKKAKFLMQKFNALACEMEGASVAQVCYQNKVPFAVIRSLSDMAGQYGVASHSFNELKYMAAQRAALVTNYFLKQL